MKKNLEEIFKESLGKHEMPYDPAAWNAVKNELPKSTVPYVKIGLIAATFTALLSISIILLTKPNPKAITKNESPATSSTESANNQAADRVVAQNSNLGTEEIERSITQPKTVVDNQNATVDFSQNHQSSTNTTDLRNDRVTETNVTNGPDETTSNYVPKPDKWLSEAQLSSINLSAHTICLGDIAHMRINDLPNNTLVEWTMSNGETMYGASISVEPSKSETVSAKLINKLNTKITLELPIERIVVLVPQEFIITTTEDIKNTKPYFTVENKNHQIQQTSWSMDFVKSKENQLSFYLVDLGTYTYSVSGIDQNGCKVDYSGSVTLNDSYNLFAPTGFSPNGDGINETFIPVALLSRDVEFKMTIVDRSGNTVYETIDQHQPWDGTMLNGQRAQIGNNFMWVVTLINEEGLPEKYSGTIVIVK